MFNVKFSYLDNVKELIYMIYQYDILGTPVLYQITLLSSSLEGRKHSESLVATTRKGFFNLPHSIRSGSVHNEYLPPRAGLIIEQPR